MNVAQLQKEFTDYASSLLTEGLLDAQFKELQYLSDDDNIGSFVTEVVTLYFGESQKIINGLTHQFEQSTVDFKQVSSHAHNLKGSSASIGAARVKDQCVLLREHCDNENAEECRGCLQQLRDDFFLLKSKLETLFKIKEQIVAAGGAIPTIN